MIFSVIILVIGAYLLFDEFDQKMADGVPILLILLSPLTAFAYSLTYIGYRIFANGFRNNIKPKDPYFYSPKKQFRKYLFSLLNWIIIVASILYIFTNEWFGNGSVWGLLGGWSLVIFFLAFYQLSIHWGKYLNQKKYGDSSIYLTSLDKDHVSGGRLEFMFQNQNLAKYASRIFISLNIIEEGKGYMVDDSIPFKILDSLGPFEYELTGHSTLIEIPHLSKTKYPTDYDKRGGVTYWEIEIKSSEKNYCSYFYLDINQE